MDTEKRRQLHAIGSRIKERRTELGLTQVALAEAAQVSKSFFSDVEAGQTAASGLAYLRIAEALDVSIQWLLTGATSEVEPAGNQSISIPPIVSELAEEKGWKHSETLEVAGAIQSVMARRTRDGRRWEPTRDYVLQVAEAIRGGAGQRRR